MTREAFFDQFLAPVLRLVIDEEAFLRPYRAIDWAATTARIADPAVCYPNYYLTGNFHGIPKGYLSMRAAVTYDPITGYVLFPNESWVRECLVNAVSGRPRRILDIGCGTGSTTVLLKQAFPEADVVGLDLSPDMLVAAELKAQSLDQVITWLHADARATGLAEGSFDLVSASLLFHETPPEETPVILREMFRLLAPGGECLILDGSQKTLHQVTWLMRIFEEPHIETYAAGNLDAWLAAAGFTAVQTEEHWLIHQVSRGRKPLGRSGSLDGAHVSVGSNLPGIADEPA